VERWAINGEGDNRMASASIRLISAILACGGVLLTTTPAAAQTLEELDTLVQASAKPKEGLALARAQAAAGAWLDALATLERVLATDPKHKHSRLLHASILCRLDDADGAKVEFSRLKSGDYKKADWAEAIAPCNALKAVGA
jgi:hypothetical protein